jgi:hypothetical protein
MGCGCGSGNAGVPANAWQESGSAFAVPGSGGYRYEVSVRDANGQLETIQRDDAGNWLSESAAYALVSRRGGGGVQAVLIS